MSDEEQVGNVISGVKWAKKWSGTGLHYRLDLIDTSIVLAWPNQKYQNVINNDIKKLQRNILRVLLLCNNDY